MAPHEQASALTKLLSALIKTPDESMRDDALRLLKKGSDEAVVLENASTPAELRVAAAKLLRWMATREAAVATKPTKPSRTSARAKEKARRDAKLEVEQKLALDRAADLAPQDRPVESLAGVGASLGKALRRKGIETLSDLVLMLPRRYEDERVLTPIGQLVPGTRAVTVGRVVHARWTGFRGKMRMAEVVLEPIETDVLARYATLRLMWFRAPGGLVERFEKGRRVRASGTIEEYRGIASISHPETLLLDDDGAVKGLEIVPRYPEIPGVAPRILARTVRAAVSSLRSQWPESIPAAIRAHEGISRLGDALYAIHHPPATLDDAELLAWNEGRTKHHERLVLEEFFVLELSLHRRQIAESGVVAEPLVAHEVAFARAMESLPFALTGAQTKVVGEIRRDMSSDRPMRRLLQGDVGSGKTAVAMLAAAHAVSAGGQVALLAPTEILAEQHFRSMQRLASAMGLRIGLFLGGDRASHRKKVRAELAHGVLDVAVGTHALLEDSVVFRRLRLAIVDEQHRFGVAQRLRLVEKASSDDGGRLAPHLLVMTATPIPRTLALSVYGDLEVSVIDEMPPGRKPTITRAYRENERERALAQMERAIEAGGRAYVICPLVEESDEMDLRDATTTFEELSARFPSYGVALLHGRLSSEDKHAAIGAFSKGDARILVSTTVVEVGVDVPEANVILIEHAERFGLAQLHQLRGRVGRGGQTSACLLVHDAKGEDATARIRTLCDTTDGFRIAEADLEIRGPGELFGRKQSGVPGFRFGDLRRDVAILERARSFAKDVFERDPELALDEHRGAREAVDRLADSSRRVIKEEAG